MEKVYGEQNLDVFYENINNRSQNALWKIL